MLCAAVMEKFSVRMQRICRISREVDVSRELKFVGECVVSLT